MDTGGRWWVIEKQSGKEVGQDMYREIDNQRADSFQERPIQMHGWGWVVFHTQAETMTGHQAVIKLGIRFHRYKLEY